MMTAAGMDGRGDGVYDQLAVTLAGLQRHVRHMDRTTRVAESNRLTMLYWHAICAMFTGPLFAIHMRLTGFPGASFAQLHHVPGAFYQLATAMTAGGAILAVGTILRRRRLAIVGLLVITAWYMTIFVSFAAAVLVWGSSGAPTAVPQAIPAAYAVTVYVHPAGVMLVHLRTILRQLHQLRNPEPQDDTE